MTFAVTKTSKKTKSKKAPLRQKMSKKTAKKTSIKKIVDDFKTRSRKAIDSHLKSIPKHKALLSQQLNSAIQVLQASPKNVFARTGGDVERRIILLSDGTGETAALMTKAAMVQFSDQNVFFNRYKNVRNETQIDAILESACETQIAQPDLVIYTMVSPELRAFLLSAAVKRGIPTIDLLGPLLHGLGSYFGYKPNAIAGLLHNVGESYFHRISAMEYTLQHDDGRDLTELDQADLIILGISRTSKTPLSMYLSHQGWKIANVPLIKGFEVPPEVYAVDQRRVIGLTIDATELATIRRNRLERLGQDKGGDYADPEKVIEETEYAGEIFSKHRRWPVFNVTGKALEEIAAEIIKLMASRRLTPPHTLENPYRPAITPKNI